MVDLNFEQLLRKIKPGKTAYVVGNGIKVYTEPKIETLLIG
jgi:hypothetical protein